MAKKSPKEKLSDLGKKVLDDVEEKKNPKIEIPIRSLSNVIYDEGSKSLSLGDKTSKRFFFKYSNFNLIISCELSVYFEENMKLNRSLQSGVEEDVSLLWICPFKY